MKLNKKSNYLFTSERLGFRNWCENDQLEFAKMNADPDVMAHFPKVLTKDETITLMKRLQRHYETNGYTYFAVDVLSTNAFIGFIGCAKQTYEAQFTPATDIGWRLKRGAWGKGYATEGAKRCLEYAFTTLKLHRIIATCVPENTKSERVMQNIGMLKKGTFTYPKTDSTPAIKECLYYEIQKP